MKCPFLRETTVKYCQASAFRKMIVEAGSDTGRERCSSSSYIECAAAAPLLHGEPQGERCPFLHDAQVEYCGAASVTKFIPASDALLCRCNSDSHFYCELYLAHADPMGDRLPAKAYESLETEVGDTPVVDGILVPPHLSYAPNHMWLDVAEDGFCHVGIDGFLAKVVGTVDKVSFVTSSAIARPVAVLTVKGVDLQMVFPNPMQRTAANVYLRTNPAKLTADPYGAGWLFEGFEPARPGGSAGDTVREGLISGESAVAWIRGEAARLSDFAHECISRPEPDGTRLMADGGRFVPGIAASLERDDLINLSNDFFALHAAWRRSM
ncbi:MAG TPA: hypothetical protein VEZ11_08380 [Thermoanaerobaculia bacterium]|nr:hypothetical protein [Thermoanaerobaculia bacterium]